MDLDADAASALSPSGARPTPGLEPMRLRHILLDLLDKVMQGADEGAVELRVLTVAGGTAVRLEIADTSPGVPADKDHPLCERFERLDTYGTRINGPGLGSLSKQLAILVGGRAGYDENPGGANVSWLELPLDAPPMRALNVLLVDDVAMNRDVVASFLRAAGHTTTCVGSGAAAIAAAAITDFDIVLMDVRMPEMDGLETTRRIRAFGDARGRVPIMALTSRFFPKQVAACLEAGMDAHLVKSFNLDALLATVEQAAAGSGSGKSRSPVSMAANSVIPLVLDPMACDRYSWQLVPPGVAANLQVIEPELPIFDQTVLDEIIKFLSAADLEEQLLTLIARGEGLLCRLHMPGMLSQGSELAEAAHKLAGAGTLGFSYVADAARRFEVATETGGQEMVVLADHLATAIKASMPIARQQLGAILTILGNRPFLVTDGRAEAAGC